MTSLHPFQAEAARQAFNATGRHLCVSPTGTGKSLIIAGVVSLARGRGDRVLVLVHRKELLQQTVARLAEFGFTDVAVMAPGQKDIKPLTVGMAQTARRRYARLDEHFDFVILDEAHRDEFKVVHQAPPKRLVGFTATPVRGDRPLKDWFDELRVAITYPAAIEKGYIVRARVYAPSIPTLTGLKTARGDYEEEELARRMMSAGLVGDVSRNWAAVASQDKTIVFAVNIMHARAIQESFKSIGVEAGLITGQTLDAERAITLQRFRTGSLRVLVNVAVFIEGLDVADASCVIVARPTKSLSFWMQMAGRGCRAFPGKSSYRVMDHGANVFIHGSPSDDRGWSLDGERLAAQKKRASALRYCKGCFYVFAGGERCPNCFAAQVAKEVRMKDGVLEEVKPEAYKPMEGFINAYEKGRRRAFAEGNAKGLKGQALFVFVNRALTETVAIQRRSGQLIIPKNPLLLF